MGMIKYRRTTRETDGIGCAKLVVFCNAPEIIRLYLVLSWGGEPTRPLISVSAVPKGVEWVKQHPASDLGTMATPQEYAFDNPYG